MKVFDLVFSASFLYAIIRAATPLLLATMGSVLSTNAGTLNITLEGMMLMGALAGVLVSAATQSVILGVLGAVCVSVLVAALMAAMTLRFSGNAMLCGLAVNMFASGGTVFLLYAFTGQKGNSVSVPSLVVPNVEIPLIKDIPILGEALSGHNLLTYLAIVLTVVVIILVNRTPYGLHLRAVGKNENAARSIGISVPRIQTSAWLLCGVLCGLAGAFMSMGYVSWFTRDMTASRGWIALAASSLGQGRPLASALAAILFAVAEALANVLGLLEMPGNLIRTIPYFATLIILVISSAYGGKKVKSSKNGHLTET